MATTYVLYNPQAGRNTAAPDFSSLVPNAQCLRIDELNNYAAFFDSLLPEDRIILVGGDGTINRFVNDTEGIAITQEIWYYPNGTGNDFAHDLGKTAENGPFPITTYLKDLPVVTVKGKTYRFLNAVGYGIDGYCCEVGDKLRQIPDKKVNYTAIAIKGMLFGFKPANATVTVDGTQHFFKRAWIAPTMHGRFYGGGIMPAPYQQRNNGEKLSCVVFHGSRRLKTLIIFPKLFKGTHLKHKKHIALLEGKQITVEFDRPIALQIDGETILDVTSYSASLSPAQVPEAVTI